MTNINLQKGLLLLAVSFLYGALLNAPNSLALTPSSEFERVVSQDTTQQYVRGVPHDGQIRHEYVFLLITSTSCPAATNPEGVSTLQKLIAEYEAIANEQNAVFVKHAIGIDWDVEEGFGIIQSIGSFDEVSIGRNWINEAAMSHIWNDEETQPSVPQVLVFTRDVIGHGMAGFEYANYDRKATHTGLLEIEEALSEL